MNEHQKALLNTAVKPNNDVEEKAIIALYELAGFKKWNNDVAFERQIPSYEYITLHGNNFEILLAGKDGKDVITLDQLAWDHGLAPEWATDLRVTGNELGYNYYFTDGESKYHKLNDKDESSFQKSSAIAKAEIISTRPQQAAEQPTAPDEVVLTEKAGGYDLKHFHQAGWTNAQLIHEGYAELAEQPTAPVKWVPEVGEEVRWDDKQFGTVVINDPDILGRIVIANPFNSYILVPLAKLKPEETERDLFIEALSAKISLRSKSKAEHVCGEVFDALEELGYTKAE